MRWTERDSQELAYAILGIAACCVLICLAALSMAYPWILGVVFGLPVVWALWTVARGWWKAKRGVAP